MLWTLSNAIFLIDTFKKLHLIRCLQILESAVMLSHSCSPYWTMSLLFICLIGCFREMLSTFLLLRDYRNLPEIKIDSKHSHVR